MGIVLIRNVVLRPRFQDAVIDVVRRWPAAWTGLNWPVTAWEMALMWTYSRVKSMHRQTEAAEPSQVPQIGAGQLVDRRPTAIAQARLQEMADNSTRSSLSTPLPAAAGREAARTSSTGSVAQLAMSKEQADKELADAMAGANLEEQHDAEEELTDEYYLDGSMENPYINAHDMALMMEALNRYMSLELDGLEPTPEQQLILSDGWVDFVTSFNAIMEHKHYGGGAPVFLRKFARTSKAQPEMPAGKTIPEIIDFLAKKDGQVCNQSIGEGILEILERFKRV